MFYYCFITVAICLTEYQQTKGYPGCVVLCCKHTSGMQAMDKHWSSTGKQGWLSQAVPEGEKQQNKNYIMYWDWET